MDILVNIDVPDLKAGLDFYTRAFDLLPGRRFEGFAELLGAGSAIYLLERAAGSRATPAGGERSYGRHWTPTHLDYVVTGIEAAIDRAVAAGAVPEGPLRSWPWGRIAQFSDPFGNGFCILEFGERGYDAIALPTAPG